MKRGWPSISRPSDTFDNNPVFTFTQYEALIICPMVAFLLRFGNLTNKSTPSINQSYNEASKRKRSQMISIHCLINLVGDQVTIIIESGSGLKRV